MSPKITVIICHHKGKLIQRALESVLRSKFVELQVIVVTSDPTFRYNGGVKIVFQQGGPAKKRNIGFRFAEHPSIAFFDDDVEVRSDTIFELWKSLQKDGIGMVFGKLLNMEHRNRFDEAGSFLTWSGFLWARAESGIRDVGQFEDEVPILAGKSASCMIKRRVFSEIGMFDVSYEILGEETDLAWRVWLHGHKVLYVPSSVTYHAFNTKYKPPEFYTSKRVYFNGCRNYIAMLITNLSLINLIVPLTVQVIVWSSASLGFLVTGKFEAGWNILKGLSWVVLNLEYILKKRKTVQGSRKVSDHKLMPFIRRSPPLSYYVNRFFSYIKHGRHGGSYDSPKSPVVLPD